MRSILCAIIANPVSSLFLFRIHSTIVQGSCIVGASRSGGSEQALRELPSGLHAITDRDTAAVAAEQMQALQAVLCPGDCIEHALIAESILRDRSRPALKIRGQRLAADTEDAAQLAVKLVEKLLITHRCPIGIACASRERRE